MSFFTDESKSECERIFKYLDKKGDNRLTSNQVILGLGALGKICSSKEQKAIETKSRYYDLDEFINLCKAIVSFNNIDNNLNIYFKNLESKKHPGYVPRKNLDFVLKKFNNNTKEKDINEIIKEIGDEKDEYINIESLVKELLVEPD